MTNRWRLIALVLSGAVMVGSTSSCSDGGTPRDDRAARAPGGSDPTTTATPAPSSSRTRQSLPRSMAALGDSMTRASAACPGTGDCPAVSWSTGSAERLDSHAQRIAQATGRTPVVHNLAVSGATVSGLDSQVEAAVAADVDYVTILIGANDVCASTEAAMRPVADFRDIFRAALARLVQGLPRARVLVVSVPDLARLWRVGKDDDEVVATWEQYAICQSMLGSARSDDGAVRARRDRVRARVADYNRVMAAACATYSTCRSDGGAVFDYRFSLEMVSRADYWHPSAEGQRALAEISWAAGYWR